MKKTISKHMFIDGFNGQYQNNFSYEGKIALFNYLEECEQDLEIEIEFDAVELCSRYKEYANFEEFINDYSEIDGLNKENIDEYTIVIKIDGTEGFIIEEF